MSAPAVRADQPLRAVRHPGAPCRTLAAFFFLIATGTAYAQNTPVGLWKTIDDHTGQEKSLVRVSESAGVVSGRIERLLHPSQPNPLCDKCRDERHGKPMVGLSIITGVVQRGDVWDGGKILDPGNGKIYAVRLRPLDGGRQLEVRGYIGPFFRTQIWSRVE
ncbi:MAG TPA: DUF2147 domain-containing protein [Steroidobacteraceae bacterium]|jgi:uncharacterized protein (DUF2147 family)